MDGLIPKDNPFTQKNGALKEIWSIGHRNPQGAIWNPITKSLWSVSHGAMGGDEINHIVAGKNYGWPVISYGRHYSGAPIGEGTYKLGMEQPIYYWDPSIAPSGFTHYRGKVFPKWDGDFFIGSLKLESIIRLKLEQNRVIDEERLFIGQFGRVRDIRQGPKGHIYFITDDNPGGLYKIKPR